MRHRFLSVLLATACLGVLRAEEPQAPPDFGKLVADLASPDYQARERASEALAAAGETARAALQAAVSSTDLEVRTRAQNLLGALDARIREAEARKQEAEQKKLMAGRPVRPMGMNAAGIRIQAAGNQVVREIDPKDMALLEEFKGREIGALKARCASCPEALAAQLKVEGGVLVRECLGKPSLLEPHDLIVAAGGKPVKDLQALEDALTAAAGNPLELAIYRKGEKIMATLKLPTEMP